MSYEKFQMHDLGDGSVEILEMRPVSLGVLTSRPMAEKFVSFLNTIDPDALSNHYHDADAERVAQIADELDPEIKSDRSAEAGRLSIPEFARHPAATRQSSPFEVILPAGPRQTMPAHQAGHVAQPGSGGGSDTDLSFEAAFRMLEAGETVTAVAGRLGIPMPLLRGRWAARVKHRRQAVTAPASPGQSEAPASAVIGEQTDCRICGRSHKASLHSDGLCARCTRDLGAA